MKTINFLSLGLMSICLYALTITIAFADSNELPTELTFPKIIQSSDKPLSLPPSHGLSELPKNLDTQNLPSNQEE